jgi:hypothetical protein
LMYRGARYKPDRFRVSRSGNVVALVCDGGTS